MDDGAFGTVAELADAAELVVVATVTDETSLGRPQAADDPSADEFLGLTVSVESVLKGPPIAEVLLAWDAYVVDGSGARVAATVLNGLPVPHVGDQLLLFLRPVDAPFKALLDGFPTHSPVALDGIAFIEAGMVSITDSSALDSAGLAGKTIDQVRAVL